MSTMLELPLTVALPAAAAVLVSSGCADRLTDLGPARASASARRADAARLAAMADEAGESRLYAGIHYRFDKDAALHIARQVADLALSRGVDDAHGWPGER